MDVKVQIEEAKREEEVLKNQLIEKDELSLKMEMEIMDLRKKSKLKDSSTILNEILDSQKPFNDKTGLGYNRLKEPSGSGKHDMTPFFVKEKGKELIQNVEKEHKQTRSCCQNSPEENVASKGKHCTRTPSIESKVVDQEHKKKTPPDITSARKSQEFRYEHPSMVIVFLVTILVIKLSNVRIIIQRA